MIIAHFRAQSPAPVRLGLLGRVGIVEDTLEVFWARVHFFPNVDEKEFCSFAVSLVEPSQMNHLLAEILSAEATENEENWFVSLEVAKPDRSTIAQSWQREIRGCLP